MQAMKRRPRLENNFKSVTNNLTSKAKLNMCLVLSLYPFLLKHFEGGNPLFLLPQLNWLPTNRFPGN